MNPIKLPISQLLIKKWAQVNLPFFLILFLGFNNTSLSQTTFKLLPAPKIKFNSLVDCNMAEVWVGDIFRIFPGKYGEDPLWGNAKDLKYSDYTSLRP